MNRNDRNEAIIAMQALVKDITGEWPDDDVFLPTRVIHALILTVEKLEQRINLLEPN